MNASCLLNGCRDHGLSCSQIMSHLQHINITTVLVTLCLSFPSPSVSSLQQPVCVEVMRRARASWLLQLRLSCLPVIFHTCLIGNIGIKHVETLIFDTGLHASGGLTSRLCWFSIVAYGKRCIFYRHLNVHGT